MGGIATQSPAVLKNNSGAANVGSSSGATVEARLATLDANYTSLAATAAGKVSKIGDNLSGSLVFDNSKGIAGKDTGGVQRNIAYYSAANNLVVGDTGIAASFVLIVGASSDFEFRTNTNTRFDITNAGIRLNGANTRVNAILDEDSMSSNSATALATQQSVKAYVDNSIAAIPEPGMVLLSSADISSAVAAVDIVLPGAYDEYIVEVLNIVPSTDDAYLRLRTSTDGGATFDSGGSDYAYLWRGVSDDSSSGIDCIKLCYETTGFGVGNDTNENGFSGSIKLIRPKVAAFCQVLVEAGYRRADSAQFLHTFTLGARRLAAADVDAVRLYFSTGNIASGKVALYGVNR